MSQTFQIRLVVNLTQARLMLTLKMVSNGKRVCLCQCLSMWRHQASGGKGEARKWWANDGCSKFPLNELLLTRALMTVLGFEEGWRSKGGRW